jgi:hypothetical protein
MFNYRGNIERKKYYKFKGQADLKSSRMRVAKTKEIAGKAAMSGSIHIHGLN